MNLWGHRFFQNPNQKLQRFLPYLLINFECKYLCNFWLGYWKNQWSHKFILNLTKDELLKHLLDLTELSINNVDHFFRIYDTPSPLLAVLLYYLLAILTNSNFWPPPSQLPTSFMDGPLQTYHLLFIHFYYCNIFNCTEFLTVISYCFFSQSKAEWKI